MVEQRSCWFISDQAIEDASDDAFGHNDVAGQLVEMITSVTPPATIGLLGGFGTGKSSIGNLLSQRLKGHEKYAVVSLSAEKHSDAARQRALIFSFAEALEVDAGVDPRAISQTLGRVEHSEDLEGPELNTLPVIEWIKENRGSLIHAGSVLLVIAAVLYLAGVVGALLVRALGWADVNPLTWPVTTAYLAVPVLTGLFGGFVTLMAGWSKDALIPRRLTKSRPRAEAADELERVFGELAALVDKQLVIVVDDIDRLAPNEVMEALASIKSLQAVPRACPPLFVLSCDDATVLEALVEARPGLSKVDGSARVAAEEYLNKLFVVRQPLPPHLKDDMQQFAMKLLVDHKTNHAGTVALGDHLRPVLEVLIHDGVHSPRHVIRLLNAFFADYRLAKTREASEGRLGVGEVTDAPLTLARLAVLRVDFPRCYDAVRDEFELLAALDLLVLDDELDEAERRLLQATELLYDADGWHPVLDENDDMHLPVEVADFLRRTARFVERDVPLAPFFFMGQTAAGRILGSKRAEGIRRALENNDVEAIRVALQDEASVADAAVEHMKASLQAARPGLPQKNAVATTAFALPDAPDRTRGELANAVAQIIGREPGSVPPPDALVNVIRFADGAFARGLIARLVQFEDDPSAADNRAQAVLALASERPSDDALLLALDGYFEVLPESAGWADAVPWIERAEAVDPPVRQQILRAAFYSGIVQTSVGTTDDAIDADVLGHFTTMVSEAPSSVRASTTLLEAAREAASAEGKEPRWFAVHVLGALEVPAAAARKTLQSVVAVVSDDGVGAWETALAQCMKLTASWARENTDALLSMPDEDIDGVVAAISTCLKHPDSVVVRSAAGALAAVASLWPHHIEPAVSSAVERLAEHQDPSDDDGEVLQNQLIAVAETASDEVVEQLSTGLLGVLDSADDAARPAVAMALAAVPRLAQTSTGDKVLAPRLGQWRTRFDGALPNTASCRPPLEALAAAARAGSLPEDQEQALLNRFLEMPAQGGVMAEVAAVGLAMVPWRTGHQPQATQALGASWEALAPAVRDEIAQRVAGWPPDVNEFHETFSQHLTSHILESEHDNLVGAVWPALTPGGRAQLAAEGLDTLPSVRELVDRLTVDELLGALHRTQSTEAFVGLLDAAGPSGDAATSVARRLIEGSLDETLYGWDDNRVRAVVPLLSTGDAKDLVPDGIGRLGSGESEASQAALLLAELREIEPETLRDHRDALVSAVLDHLHGEGSPAVVERLGAVVKDVDGKHFADRLKELRKRGSSQESRTVADAFANGRNR